MTPEIQAKIQRFYKIKDNPSLALFEFIQEIEKALAEKLEKEINNFKLKAEKELEAEKENFRIELFKKIVTKGHIDEFVKAVYSLIPKDGRDGITPIAGVNYPDKKQIEGMIRQFVSQIIPELKDGKTPIKGMDYFTDKEIEEIMKEIYAELKSRIKEINASDIKDLKEFVSNEARGMVSAAERGYVARIAKRTIRFEWIEPDGECNGVNTTFTLPYAPYNSNTIMFFVNGALQKKDDDYTIDGKIITTTTAPPTGSVKWAFFKK